jgi:hypothetical protein
VAGIFLFLPLLARLRFDDLVTQAGYPGSGMIPPPAALLSLLTLKLLDKERRSHITAFDFDEALGLFAGLNVLPKKSYATDYSYRTTRACQHGLLSRWVAALAPLLFPDAREFDTVAREPGKNWARLGASPFGRRPQPPKGRPASTKGVAGVEPAPAGEPPGGPTPRSDTADQPDSFATDSFFSCISCISCSNPDSL